MGAIYVDPNIKRAVVDRYEARFICGAAFIPCVGAHDDQTAAKLSAAFKRGDTSSLDPVWAIYGVLDLTREGRGDSAAYPNLQY